jgi:hypothetical protein
MARLIRKSGTSYTTFASKIFLKNSNQNSKMRYCNFKSAKYAEFPAVAM